MLDLDSRRGRARNSSPSSRDSTCAGARVAAEEHRRRQGRAAAAAHRLKIESAAGAAVEATAGPAAPSAGASGGDEAEFAVCDGGAGRRPTTMAKLLEEHETFLLPLAPAGGAASCAQRDGRRPPSPYSLFLFCGLTSTCPEDEEELIEGGGGEEEEEEAGRGGLCFLHGPAARSAAARFAAAGALSFCAARPQQRETAGGGPGPPLAPPPATSGSSASKKPPSWWELFARTMSTSGRRCVRRQPVRGASLTSAPRSARILIHAEAEGRIHLC